MKRSKKLTIAGILNIVSGAFLCLWSFGGCMNVINAGRFGDAWMIALLIPGIISLISGFYALERKRWCFALAGSILAIPAVLGIPATVMTVLSRKDFH